MSLLWAEGFDGLSAAQILTSGEYEAGSGMQIDTGGRNGNGHRLNGSFTGAFVAVTPVGLNTGFVGMAFKIDGTPGSDLKLGSWMEGTTEHVVLYINSSRQLKLTRGSAGTVLGTGATVLLTSTQYYVELQIKCHDSAGTYELRIDGATELSATGVDTRNGGTAGSISGYRVPYSTAYPTSTYVDDMYVCDDQGSLNNTFRGNTVVESRLAVAGNGANTDWSLSTGSDHGALVDEATPNDDTDYIHASSVGQIDTFNMQDISLTGAVIGVFVMNWARKTDAGARSIRAVARSGGTNYASASDLPLSTTYKLHATLFEADPATSAAWADQAAVNACEFGPKLTV